MSKLQPSIKFLIDESVEYRVVIYLRSQGFDVASISEENPSILDSEVLGKAFTQDRILITNDKGFSRLIFKEKQKSRGVILIRLPDFITEEKIFRLAQVIKSKNRNLSKVFTTIAEKQFRSKSLLGLEDDPT